MHFSRRRHVWVRREYGVTKFPGLVLEWMDDGARARVMFVTDEGKVFTEVMGSELLTVIDAQPFTGSAYG